MPTGAERDCDHGDTEGTGTTTCPKAGELPAGTTMPAGCGHTPGEVSGTTDTTCPEAGTAPTAGTMPAGCLTPTSVTTSGLTPGAVLASELEAPAAAGIRTEVLGEQLSRGETAAAAATAPAGASVLGAVVNRGAALAFTGFGLTMLLGILALALLAVGFFLRRLGRPESEV
jgi:hypothetical protein